MPTLAVPNAGNNKFRVINSTSIEYLGQVYEDVGDIEYPDGTRKSCDQLITEAGGAAYAQSELKRGVKVEGYDKDQDGRQIFTLYSNNTQQVGKNVDSQIPGGAWIETFTFLGTAEDNHILQIWKEHFASLTPPVDYLNPATYNKDWIGFKINYGVAEKRAYVVTKVNDFDEEGIPSAPKEIDTTYLTYVDIRGKYLVKPPISAGGLQHYYVRVKEYRVYRSAVASTLQVELKLVTGLSQRIRATAPNIVSGDFFTNATAGAPHGWAMLDDLEGDQLGEGIPSVLWDPPIYNECQGLTEWRNGMMVAYWKNTLKVFEPFRPFAQPRDYQIALPYNIVGLATEDNALVVFTENAPYLFVGSHPTNITYEKMQNALGALPGPVENSIVLPTRASARTPIGLVYRTIDGPAVINGQSVRLLGRAMFTRDEWVNTFLGYHPNMRMAYLDGRIFVYFAGVQAFSYAMPVDESDLTLTRINLPGDSFPLAHYERKTAFFGATTLLHSISLTDPATAAAFMWPTEARLPWSYRSRVWTLGKPESLSAFQIKGEGNGSLRVKIFGDDLTFANVTVNFTPTGQEHRHLHRIPAIRKAQRWSFELLDDTGGVTVYQVQMATNPSELAGG